MFSLNLLNSVTTECKIKRIVVFEPTISCAKDRDATIVPGRHLWCDTCCPHGGQHVRGALWIHVLIHLGKTPFGGF